MTTTSMIAETLLIRIPAVKVTLPRENQVHSAVKGGLFQVEKKTTNAAIVFVSKRNGAEIETSQEYLSEMRKATTNDINGSVIANIRHVI